MSKNTGLGAATIVLFLTSRFSSQFGVPAPAADHAAPNPGRSATGSRNAKPLEAKRRSKCTAYEPESARNDTSADDTRGAAYKLVTRFVQEPGYGNADRYDDIRFVIALAPDPAHTNLTLLFDREMAALQQAAQDEGYSFDSSWMPWRSNAKSYLTLADDKKKEELEDNRQTCPGIISFWKDPPGEKVPPQPEPKAQELYKTGLIVLVVGEQPTGGINEEQWRNAIEWILQRRAASHGEHILRILGPTFTGSLISLQRALELFKQNSNNVEKLEKNNAEKLKQIQVLSGTVSSCRLLAWFQKQLKDDGVAGTFQENDALQIHRFLDYLAAGGWNTDEVAVISEDETAYAQNAADVSGLGPCGSWTFTEPKSRPVFLSYPRDISALRAAYQKEAIGVVDSQKSRIVLNDNADGPEPNEEVTDSIKAYAGKMTPIAQEGVLYGLVGYLRTHHIRHIVLRATNPLDFVFLARFFHRAYPQGRIVTVGSDLLFVREFGDSDFRGMLSLSNYPLIPAGEALRKEEPGPHMHREFESHASEGTYLAGRFSFGDDRNVGPGNGKITAPILSVTRPLLDWKVPNWVGLRGGAEAEQPPTWLSVLARDGYWPVAVLTTPDSARPKGKAIPLSTAIHYKLAPDKSGKEKPGLPLSWWVFGGLAFLLFSYVALGIALNSRSASIGLLSPFRFSFASSHAILLGENAALACAPLLLFLLLTLGSETASAEPPSYQNWPFWTVGFLIGLSALVRWLIESAKELIGSAKEMKLRWNFIFLSSLVCTLTFTMLASFVALGIDFCADGQGSCGSDHHAIYQRIFHLTSGISPMLPILFLLFGLYLWNWHALAGNGLLAEGRPLLPARGLNDYPPSALVRRGLDKSDRSVTASLKKPQWFRISREIEWRILRVTNPLCAEWPILVVTGLLAAGSIGYSYKNLPLLGFERYQYSMVMDGALLLTLLLTIAESLRLLLTWSELRQLLAALQRLRLRRTFSRLRAIDATSLWSVSGAVSRIQYRFFTQQIDAGRRLLLLCDAAFPALRIAVQCADEFAKENAGEVMRGPDWSASLSIGSQQITIREALADAAAEVLNELAEVWDHETESLDLEPKADGEKSAHSQLPLSDDPAVQAAEQFVCFHYIAFIQNILGRMRTMTLSMLLAFVFSCFCVSFYPFVPRSQVSIWMIANLALIGLCVIFVYAKMERDEILSYITNTAPGQLTIEFWVKSAAFLIGPVIGILTTQFPQIADALLSSLQPGLEAFKKASGG